MKYTEGVNDNFCLRNIVARAQGLQEIPLPSTVLYNTERLEDAIISNTPESTELQCQVERCAAGCSILFESGKLVETNRWAQGLCGQ
jgi:hypothetical protein